MDTTSRQPSETKPGRIAPLAKLPVFFDLQGRMAVVAGGSDGAAWKAELLAAAGADVTIFAAEAGAGMRELAGTALPAGSVRLVERAWQAADFENAALAIVDAEEEEEAARAAAGARAAGVPINVVDKPAFCDFQFGSIVNRSPVLVGICTDGAAPVLGQAIRRRIETLLPPFLGEWAAAVKEMRGELVARISHAGTRRGFWERFADLAFRQAPRDDATAQLRGLVDRIAERGFQGRVTLVGAGPGDPEFLTIKAVRALQSADIILFDDLISNEVLELARREAQRMLVGKRGQRASCRQEDINALMVRLARQGKHVVRLKSGDPMIFGRAGEEIAELQRHAIPVEIVPGVTSALAMASKLGVSLTHRDAAHSVRFVTGHSRDGSLPDLGWRGIADPETTLVVYMGGRTCAAFAARLVAEGLAPSTPATAAWALGQPDEHVVGGTLATLPAMVAEIGFDSPVLLGIGSVFASAARQTAAQPPRSAALAG